MPIERRKHRRFQVKDNAFTVINSAPVKMVPIIDIGLGGLGIYLDDGSRWLDTSSTLEIMAADCSFYLEKLPFQIAANTRPFPDKAFNLIDGRRYGIKFGILRPAQKAHLKYFMRNYTEKGTISNLLQSINQFLHPIWTKKYSVQSCNTRTWQGLHRSSL